MSRGRSSVRQHTGRFSRWPGRDTNNADSRTVPFSFVFTTKPAARVGGIEKWLIFVAEPVSMFHFYPRVAGSVTFGFVSVGGAWLIYSFVTQARPRKAIRGALKEV